MECSLKLIAIIVFQRDRGVRKVSENIVKEDNRIWWVRDFRQDIDRRAIWEIYLVMEVILLKKGILGFHRSRSNLKLTKSP